MLAVQPQEKHRVTLATPGSTTLEGVGTMSNAQAETGTALQNKRGCDGMTLSQWLDDLEERGLVVPDNNGLFDLTHAECLTWRVPSGTRVRVVQSGWEIAE